MSVEAKKRLEAARESMEKTGLCSYFFSSPVEIETESGESGGVVAVLLSDGVVNLVVNSSSTMFDLIEADSLIVENI